MRRVMKKKKMKTSEPRPSSKKTSLALGLLPLTKKFKTIFHVSRRIKGNFSKCP